MDSVSDKNKAIFQSIVTITTSPDFQKGQQEFYHKKKDIFNEDEENKLEYTDVYQDYVHLMEQILDVQLKSETHGHSEEEVDTFYQTFAQHKDAYKEINDDVMDLLFGLVDFTKFKTSVLEYKKGCVDHDAKEVDVENKKLISGK